MNLEIGNTESLTYQELIKIEGGIIPAIILGVKVTQLIKIAAAAYGAGYVAGETYNNITN